MHEVRHQATSNKKNGSTKTTAVHTGKRSQIKQTRQQHVLSASYIARRQWLYEQGRRPPPSLADVVTVAESKQTTRKKKRGGGELKHKSRQLTEEEEEANVKKRKQPTNTDDENAQKKEFRGKNVCMRLFDARNMLHNTPKKPEGSPGTSGTRWFSTPGCFLYRVHVVLFPTSSKFSCVYVR